MINSLEDAVYKVLCIYCTGIKVHNMTRIYRRDLLKIYNQTIYTIDNQIQYITDSQTTYIRDNLIINIGSLTIYINKHTRQIDN